MFKGTYRYKIDPKGRLPVPAAFRRGLGEETLVVTLFDQCLAVYPPSEWERLEGQLRALPTFNRQVKAVTRLLASRASDCPLDAQGRILLPPALRQAAGLLRETVVVGVLNRIEVWNPETWEAFVRDSERLLDDVTLDVEWPPAPENPSRHPQGKPSR